MECVEDESVLFVCHGNIIYATPPCQGMSFNSVGKRLQEIRRGHASKDDPRNQLIVPTIEIVKKLRPTWLLLENVQGMQNTIIPVENGYKIIIDYIRDKLSPDYTGGPEVVNCADYGIPQKKAKIKIRLYHGTVCQL